MWAQRGSSTPRFHNNMTRKDVTVPVTELLDDQIKDHMGYGSKAAWIRGAIVQRLRAETDWQPNDEEMDQLLKRI